MLRIKILVTLGPSSLNSKFLKFSKGNVDLLRLNLSHINSDELSDLIDYIRKYNKTTPICIDTEGAQIRTRLKFKKIFLKKNKKIFINIKNPNFNLYPLYINKILKLKDILDIGFENLILRLIKKNKNNLVFKCISPGYLETNKGVHLVNRKIKLHTLTPKDLECIVLAKRMNIKTSPFHLQIH